MDQHHHRLLPRTDPTQRLCTVAYGVRCVDYQLVSRARDSLAQSGAVSSKGFERDSWAYRSLEYEAVTRGDGEHYCAAGVRLLPYPVGLPIGDSRPVVRFNA